MTCEDFSTCLHGVLAHVGFTHDFISELQSRKLHLPLTNDAALFAEAVALGKQLLWLQTCGERMADPAGRPAGAVPQGAAKVKLAIPAAPEDYPAEFSYDPKSRDLRAGKGIVGPVAPEIWAFEVSGFKVVQSWLGYRMRERKGKKSSPLDAIGPEVWTFEMVQELLELLWVLEHSLALYPKQKALLDKILAGPLFLASELPPVPDAARKPPGRAHALPFEDENGEADGDQAAASPAAITLGTPSPRDFSHDSTLNIFPLGRFLIRW